LNRQEPEPKLEIRLAGFLSRLWSGTYWYSLKNGLFLQFRNAVNFPGSIKTITLVGKAEP